MRLEEIRFLKGWIERTIEFVRSNRDMILLSEWIATLAWYITQITISSSPNLSKQNYQLIAAASITLSTKMWEDDCYLSVYEIHRHLPIRFTQKSIVDAEWIVLEVLNYDLLKATKDCFFMNSRRRLLNEIDENG